MAAQNNTKHPMKGANSMEVTYRMQNGYQVPNLMMPSVPEVHLGKYAELRREYLKKHRRVLYTNLKTSGKLTEHLPVRRHCLPTGAFHSGHQRTARLSGYAPH